MTLPIVLFLGKRVASAALCIALAGAIPVALRGELSAHNGPEALAFERAATLPVALQGHRAWPRVGLSGRHFGAPELHAAVAGSDGSTEVGGYGTCLGRPSTCFAALLLAYARSERGPPHHTLS